MRHVSRVQGGRRPAKVFAFGFMMLAATAVLAPVLPFLTPPRAFDRSFLRHLVGSALVFGRLQDAQAYEETMQQGQEMKIGDNFQVIYYDETIGDDFFFTGGGSERKDFGQDRPLIAYVEPQSKAYAQGLRIGDELVWAQKFSDQVTMGAPLSRMPPVEIDRMIKDLAATSRVGLRDTGPGLQLNFKNCGVIQPEQPAKEFVLRSTIGILRLEDLLRGNEYLVLLFRPGFSKTRGPDLDELKAFRRSQLEFAKLNATIASVSPDEVSNLRSLGRLNKIDFPMLSDVKNENVENVAQSYGAGLQLGNIGGGYSTSRMTFVIDKKGIVKTVFCGIGYYADKNKLQAHVADVARVLGGDPDAMKQVAKPKKRSAEKMLNILVGKEAPSYGD